MQEEISVDVVLSELCTVSVELYPCLIELYSIVASLNYMLKVFYHMDHMYQIGTLINQHSFFVALTAQPSPLPFNTPGIHTYEVAGNLIHYMHLL